MTETSMIFGHVPYSLFFTWIFLIVTGIVGYVVFRERSVARDEQLQLDLKHLKDMHNIEVSKLTSDFTDAQNSIRRSLDLLAKKLETADGSEKYISKNGHDFYCKEHGKIIETRLDAMDKRVDALFIQGDRRDVKLDKNIAAIQDLLYKIATSRKVPIAEE